ncbi:MAG TPA: ATP-binding cassette domain-containing protein [Limnochordales bacterium]
MAGKAWRSRTRRLASRPPWAVVAAWAVLVALASSVAATAASAAMGAGLDRLLQSAAGRPGEYDLLVQVRQEQRPQAEAALRALAASALGGAALRPGPQVASTATFLVDLPPRQERAELLERLGGLLEGVPGYVAWVPLLEPSWTVDSPPPALVNRLLQDARRHSGVRLAFRHGGGVVVVASGPEESQRVEAWLRRWLGRFRVVRLSASPSQGLTPGSAPEPPGSTWPPASQLAGEVARRLSSAGVHVVAWGPGAGAGSGSQGRAAAQALVQGLMQYALTASVRYRPGMGRELAPGEPVWVGPLAATVVQAGPWGAVAVITGEAPDGLSLSQLAEREWEVADGRGQVVGSARLGGTRLELELALERARQWVDQLQGLQSHTRAAGQWVEQALAELGRVRGRLEEFMATLDGLRRAARPEQDAGQALVALALSVLLGSRVQAAAPAPGEPGGPQRPDGLEGAFQRLTQGLRQLQQRISALTPGSLEEVSRQLGSLRQELPDVDPGALAQLLRAVQLDQEGPAAPAAELVVQGPVPSPARLLKLAGLPRADSPPGSDVAGRWEVQVLAAGSVHPSARASALALVHQARRAAALAAGAVAVALALLNDWACLAAASLHAACGLRPKRLRRLRRAWAWGGAALGAAASLAGAWLACRPLGTAAGSAVAAAGAAAGWVAGRLALRLASVDPDSVEAGRAFGVEGSALLLSVVIPQARPGLLSLVGALLGRLPASRAGAPLSPAPAPSAAAGPQRGQPPPPVLEAEGLVKRLEGRTVLAGLDLRLWPGETVVLMGPSGCGKSTALRCLAGLYEPDGGTVRAFGEDLAQADPTRRRQLRRRIALVFQRPQLVGHLSVLDNVMLPLVADGLDPAQARERAWLALERVGAAHLARAMPARLSGGEGQRVAIARALACEPEVILWDEPTAHLDPPRVGELLELVQDLVRRLRTTMLIVTHQARFACQVAGRLVLMDGGRVVEEGPPDRVLGQPASEVGRRFAALAAW